MKRLINILLICIIIILLITLWGAMSKQTKPNHHLANISKVTHLRKHKTTLNYKGHEDYKDRILHEYYANKHNSLFHRGFDDGNNAGGVTNDWLTVRYCNNLMYKKGWIIGNANQEHFDLTRSNMTRKHIRDANILYDKSGKAIQKAKKDDALENGQLQASSGKWDD